MLLLTASNEHQAPLAELTVPLMRAYAQRHKLGFRYVPFAEPNVKEAYWKKITLTLAAFDEGFDRVFWLDVDQAITNPDLTPWDGLPEKFTYDECPQSFAASCDWGKDADHMQWPKFSMCGYVANSHARMFFERVQEKHDEFINSPFPEQDAMKEAFRSYYEFCEMQMCAILPRRMLNAVPDEVSPGNVPEPWQPGDFAAHITMVDIARRVEIFHEVMRRAKG